MKRATLLALAASLTFTSLALAQDDDKNEKGSEKPAAAASKQFPAPKAEEKSAKTQHTLHAGGQELKYTAVAGTLVLKKNSGDGDPWASVFFIAYTLDGADAAKRPVTFTFNGGPGSSSVWLHMGALGPRRVAMTDDGQAVPPPYHVVDNEQTALTYTDLVFIDPVTTGYSRHAPGEDPKQFHGVEEDLRSVSEFIRLWLTKYNRWDSPKFLAGESYGTTRAAGLSKMLQEDYGIYLNGVTLISSALDFGWFSFDTSNENGYIGFLPTYATTAWYHKKLGADMQAKDVAQVAKEAREFAAGEYAHALLEGDNLSESSKHQLAERISTFIGLPADLIERHNLRITDEVFFKNLLISQRELIGRYDSRLVGYAIDPSSERPDYDPSYAAVQGAFTAAFNDYVRKELNWQTDLPYNILTNVWPWNMSEFTNGYVNTAVRLRDAMVQNRFLHVLQMNGYYDLATPFFATENTLNHLNLPAPIRSNLAYGYCGAGHMLYLKSECRDELHKDMSSMYHDALK